jgi:predicted SAM-dependent methyltransferase
LKPQQQFMGTARRSAAGDSGPLRVIIGAGGQSYDGWVATHREQLDLCDRASWVNWFGDRRADALLCEHVFEHLTEAEGRAAAAICFEFLKPGGFLRVAVPDAFYPDPDYQNVVKIGGPGPADHPAADHRIVYDCRLLSDVLASAGFALDLLEYCDEAGRFHYNQWDVATGPIYRSLMLDHRNRDGRLGCVSLIVDARKALV